MSKRLLDEIGEKKECFGIDSGLADRVRAGVSSHPLGYGKPTRAGLDEARSRRSLEDADATKTVARQGVEPIEDRDETGTGIVR